MNRSKVSTKMTGPSNNLAERLYLLKDSSGDISVDCSDLSQHQIDCIRFLFKWYKTLNPGVILNYPLGYSASAQIVTFINAIRQELNKPILIVCNKEHDEQNWLTTINKWMNISNDSTPEKLETMFLSKKQIHIKNMADIDVFQRRQWSIVIVNSDEVSSKFLKCSLKTDFKIWITSVDIKNDREMLNLLYTWLYPRSNNILLQYFDNSATGKQAFINKITLDSILDNTLLIERNVKPFTTEKEPYTEEKPKESKKNKDATGTKIKRSKKNNETVPVLSNLGHVTSSPNFNEVTTRSNDCKDINDHANVEISSKNIEIDNENEEYKMDVESFIRDNEPLESDSNLSMAVRNLDNTSQTSLKADDGSTDSSLIFNNASDDIVHLENDPSMEVDQNSQTFSIELVEDSSSQEGIEPEAKNLRVSSVFDLVDRELNNSMNQSKSSCMPIIKNVFSVGANEGVAYMNEELRSMDEEVMDEKVVMDVTEEAMDVKEEVNIAAEEDMDVRAEFDNQETDVIFEENYLKADINEGHVDQRDMIKMNTSVISETDCSIDTKLKLLEEQALKKFKGSVLDKLF